MRIAIIGSGPSYTQAPYDDRLYEIWSYAMVANDLPRCDMNFEMHKREAWPRWTTSGTEEEHVARINALGVRTYMQQAHDDIPMSVAYPLAEVESICGGQFYCTVSYQLGLAIAQAAIDHDVEEVALYGVDMLSSEEWAYQRPNVCRMAGILQGLGVQLRTPHGCVLFGQPYRYGWQDIADDPRGVDVMLTEAGAQLGTLMHRMADLYIMKRDAELAEKRKAA